MNIFVAFHVQTQSSGEEDTIVPGEMFARRLHYHPPPPVQPQPDPAPRPVPERRPNIAEEMSVDAQEPQLNCQCNR